jgi:hypothetical protein
MLPFLLSFVDFDASPEVYERCAAAAADPPAWGLSTRRTPAGKGR